MSNKLKHIFLKRTGFFTWFFLFYAVFGFATLHRYGVHYDEITQRTIGIENARFISGRAADADVQKHRFFGPLFETPAYLAEQLIYESSTHSKIVLRRALLFAVFLGALWCFYRLAGVFFRSGLAVFLCTTMFACWPRLWAEAHYNSKDVLFLSLCIYTFYALYLGNNKKWWLIFVLAGLAISVRISGLFLLLSVIGYYAFKPEQQGKMRIVLFGVLISLLSCYLVFPALWLHPFVGFRDLLFYGANNPWPSGSTLAGIHFAPGQIPGWYTPLWMVFTLPVLYLLLFLAGFGHMLFKSFSFMFLPVLLLFAVPIIYMLAAQPTLYNAWRHNLYLYFPFIICCGHCIDVLCGIFKPAPIAAATVVIPVLMLLVSQRHDYVYFNVLKSLWPSGGFTLDYWGISTQNALKKLNRIAPKGGKIYCFTEIVDLNRNLNPHLTSGWTSVKSADSADFALVLNREGRIDGVAGLPVAADIYCGDTLWVLYRRRSSR